MELAINKSNGSPGGTGRKRPRKCSDSELGQAHVRLQIIDVDKEKEKLRKRIKQGTSTLTKEMRDTLRSRLCHQRTNGGWEEVQQKIIVTY